MIKSIIEFLVLLIAFLAFCALSFLEIVALADAFFYYEFSNPHFKHWQIWIYILLVAPTSCFVFYWIIKYKFIYVILWLSFILLIEVKGDQFVYDLGYLRVLTICDDERALCSKAKKEFQLNFGKQAAHTQEEEIKAPTEPEQTPELETETAPEPTPEPAQEEETEPTPKTTPEAETALETPQTLPKKD